MLAHEVPRAGTPGLPPQVSRPVDGQVPHLAWYLGAPRRPYSGPLFIRRPNDAQVYLLLAAAASWAAFALASSRHFCAQPNRSAVFMLTVPSES
jgi:hypothetical protein